MKTPPVIGVDFDNTIVCYDTLFHKVCLERNLIPTEVPANKSEVRNYLREHGREDDWTGMQGYVYGARMSEAEAFPGVKAFFRSAREAGVHLIVISHKTRYPFKGEAHDLHRAAFVWLEQQGLFDPADVGLHQDNVFFELTKEMKLNRIASSNCTLFIDDLPEFLAEPAFPPQVRKVLFDPNGLYPDSPGYHRIGNWMDARHLLPC